MNYEAADILIILTSELRKLEGPHPVIRLAALDDQLDFEPGTTKTHLQAAASRAGFAVTEETTNLAELRRLPVRAQRG